MRSLYATREFKEYMNANYDGSSKVIDEIQKKFQVPRYIITSHARMMGLTTTKEPKWSESDINYLVENWTLKKEETIANKLNRSITAVHLKAKRLGLGGQVKGSHYFTAHNIADILGIDAHCVTRWAKQGIIKHKLAKQNRITYLFELEEIELFLKNNPDKWDSRKMQGTFWMNEPDWMKEKRVSDRSRPNREGKKWTKEEDTKLLSMYSRGDKLKLIAASLQRSRDGIERRLKRIFDNN